MFTTCTINGIVLCCTCIFIPCGIQCIKIGCFLLCPFGKTIIVVYDGPTRRAGGCCCPCISNGFCTFLLNFIWAITVGWVFAVQALLTGVVLCLTIIGIPFGIQSFKLMHLCFCPFGKEVVTDEPTTVVQRRTTTTTTRTVQPSSSTNYDGYHRLP